MKPRHQVSKDAIELLKRFEGYRRAAAQLPGGGYTIGYGHTKTARAGVEIDERDAEALLRYDLLAISSAVNDLTFTPLTQNQFDALVCFCFNVGVENFRRSSVLRRINEGNLLQAAAALEIWRKSEFEGEKIVIDALIRRRAAEKSLFLLPPAGYVPAPSPVLPPRVDYEAVGSGPRERPVRMVVTMEGDTAVAKPEADDHLQNFVAVQPDASPITIAAEVVSAKLQSIITSSEEASTAEPGAEALIKAPLESAAEAPAVAASEEDAPAVEPADIKGPATALYAETTPETVAQPVEEEVAPLVEPQPEPAAEQPAAPVVEETAAQQEVAGPLIDFTLTPPPMNLVISETEPEPVPAPVVEPASELLPFDAPVAFPDALSPPPPPRAMAAQTEISQETLYRPSNTFSGGFDDDSVRPMSFSLAKPLALGIFGLIVFAFAIVWGLSTSNSGAGLLGPQLVSWIAGLIGIGCIVTAFYMLVSRLGGTEE